MLLSQSITCHALSVLTNRYHSVRKVSQHCCPQAKTAYYLMCAPRENQFHKILRSALESPFLKPDPSLAARSPREPVRFVRSERHDVSPSLKRFWGSLPTYAITNRSLPLVRVLWIKFRSLLLHAPSPLKRFKLTANNKTRRSCERDWVAWRQSRCKEREICAKTEQCSLKSK